MSAVIKPRPQRVSPNYEIWHRRAKVLDTLRRNPEKLASLLVYYRNGHLADMVNDWGITVDPRLISKGGDPVLPFILFPKQRDWIDWTWQNWLDGEYGLTEKSRDCGLSWLVIAFSVSLCVLFDNISITLGSYKAEKVDKLGDLGSLLEKGRRYIAGLPVEFRAGHEPSKHSLHMRLIFPHTNSTIIGEVGENIGRGGRSSLAFVDEAAHLENGAAVDASLSATTECRQDVSSVKGMNNTFAERAHRKETRKFTFRWTDDPRKDDKWYAKQLATWGPVIVAQEIDINYQASVEGIVIPAVWVQAAINAHRKLGIEPRGEWLAALDVADQGIDKNALAVRHGILLAYIESWSGKQSDIYETVEKAFWLCDLHGPCRKLIFDADGIGAGVRGDGRKINEHRATPAGGNLPKITLQAHQGSADVIDPENEMIEGRKNRDTFVNFKAQSWWALRQRFERTYRAVVGGEKVDKDSIISIPDDLPERDRLMRELSQPTYSLNNGGLILIDKQPESTQSPNLADSACMAWAPRRGGLRVDPSLLDPYGR